MNGLSGVADLAAGDGQNLALLQNGAVMAWGDNGRGQLGNGNNTGPDTCNSSACSTTPIPVSGVSGGTAIAGGFAQSLALVGRSQRLHVSLAGAGAGVVGGSGIRCPASCSERYPQAAVAILRAVPAAGTAFAGFSGACTGTGPCQVRLTQDETVSATFGRPKGTRISKAKIKQKKGKASFTFTAPGAITGFQCELVAPKRKHHKRPKAKFSSCKSTKRYKHLKPGSYTFKVRARDSLGADARPAVKKFKIR